MRSESLLRGCSSAASKCRSGRRRWCRLDLEENAPVAGYLRVSPKHFHWLHELWKYEWCRRKLASPAYWRHLKKNNNNASSLSAELMSNMPSSANRLVLYKCFMTLNIWGERGNSPFQNKKHRMALQGSRWGEVGRHICVFPVAFSAHLPAAHFLFIGLCFSGLQSPSYFLSRLQGGNQQTVSAKGHINISGFVVQAPTSRRVCGYSTRETTQFY